ncbi:MAG TPA: nuclear transport factor 2 family protein [Enhygromyxa sp.]|nr:nuclear transport factor 2 family protein [Enhygromyxa sp.]
MSIWSEITFVRSLGIALATAPLLIGACKQAEVTRLADRVDQLESEQEIRTILLDFAAIVDSGDPDRLFELAAKLHAEFSMDVIDFAGGEHRFEGIDGLVEGFGPIMASAQANLAASAIAIELAGDGATASYKFINSVTPPPELNLDVDQKLLLFAANTASFVREGDDWKLVELELDHSLAYPGSLAELDD